MRCHLSDDKSQSERGGGKNERKLKVGGGKLETRQTEEELRAGGDSPAHEDAELEFPRCVGRLRPNTSIITA